jgi:hypothetical protein
LWPYAWAGTSTQAIEPQKLSYDGGRPVADRQQGPPLRPDCQRGELPLDAVPQVPDPLCQPARQIDCQGKAGNKGPNTERFSSGQRLT